MTPVSGPADLAAPPPAPSARDPRSLTAFAVCSAIWGSTYLVIRIGEDALPPLWAATLRLAAATVILTALAWLTRQPRPRGPELRAAALFGLLNLGGSVSLLYWGETHVPSGVTAVAFGTVPITTTLLAAAFRFEPLRWERLLAGVVAVIGLAVIVSGERREAVPLLPQAAIFGATLLASLAGLALKSAPPASAIAANAAAAPVGCAVCLAGSLLLHEPHRWPSGSTALFSLAYLTIAGSTVAFVLFAYLVRRWPVTRVSLIAVVTPVIATALGAIVRHEPVTWLTVAGSALVLLAVGVSLRRSAH